MKYIKFNNTDLNVSSIVIGTGDMGHKINVEESKALLSEYVKLGGNMIDTAQVYGDWLDEQGSLTERIIGEWLDENQNRNELILVTKGGHPALDAMDVSRMNAREINKDIDGSLKNLRTDYIDLYLLHKGDDNASVPEIMECLEQARREGKIRYYGCSNWSVPRMKEAKAYCEAKGYPGFVVSQIMWSLADINYSGVPDASYRAMEKETMEYHRETGMNVMAYSSIASGYFTKRLEKRDIPENVRAMYDNPSNDKIFHRGIEILSDSKCSFVDLSYLYLTEQEGFPTVAIAAFRNQEQLKQAMESVDKEIDREVLHSLEKEKVYTYGGTVFQIQHFCTDDGPGIRTTVFLKGCHLDCAWCHNPEGKSKRPILAINLAKCVKCGICGNLCTNHRVDEAVHHYNSKDCMLCGKCLNACPVDAISICGKNMTVEEVMKQVLADKGFYESSGGGMTLSGGEILLQPEFARQLLKAAKDKEVHTCIETTGAAKYETLAYVAQYADIILYDIKETDTDNHKKYVGIGNQLILDNLRKLNNLGKDIVMRCPIIPGVNDRKEHFDALAALYNELKCVKEIQILPYHELGTGKQDRYGITMEQSDFTVPEEDKVKEWKQYLKGHLK